MREIFVDFLFHEKYNCIKWILNFIKLAMNLFIF
jgi:hypothetical protein